MTLSRSRFLQLAGAGLLAPCFHRSFAVETLQRSLRPLAYSTYGMKSIPILDAVDHCERIGYEMLELSVRKDSPTALGSFSKQQRKEFLDRVRARNLAVSSLLLGVSLAQAQREIVDVLIPSGGDLARMLDEKNPPPLVTVLGGKEEQWEQLKNVFAARLLGWAKAAEKSGAIIAVKAHYGQAVNTPEKLQWLLKRVGHERIVLSYDYSHYLAEGIGLETSLQQLASATRHIHVKDVAPGEKPVRFILPGEGGIDYVRYFRILDKLGHVGPVTVEVSAHVHNRTDYHPIRAAEKSYLALHKARVAAAASGLL